MSIDDELLRQQAEEEQENKQENEVFDNGNGIGNGNGNAKTNSDGDNNGKNKDRKHPRYLQKCTEADLIAEAVIIGCIPYFAISRKISHTKKSCEVTLESSIPIDDTNKYRPFESSAYLSEPYRFESRQDFDLTVKRARGETLDSLYEKVKRIWLIYVDSDDFHISICAADTIFTYYQDKMGLTHYLFFIGGNNCGKSNNLLVLKYLAYRNFTSTDMTAANIYQFLGSGEEGQGTLCEDEADRIDEDRQKMAIHKNGYIKGFPVARTDTSFGRKQLKYNTFCWKAFAAERFPDPVKAKGFNQRVIELQCSSGNPQQDIAEVTSPAGAEEFGDLLDELNEMRNLLLVYRLLHYHDKLPDIKLNIKGREKQLFKPVIRIFQNTKTQAELLPVISNYVIQKREANRGTLHAFLYRVIIDLIADRKTTQIESAFIWDYIRTNLQGADVPGKALSYDTSEFGILSQKEVTQTLEHIFGAKNKKSHGIKVLEFDVSKLKRLGNVYDVSPEVKVVEEEGTGDDRDIGEDLGIGRYISLNTDEHKKILETKISERESTPDNSPTDPSHRPYGPYGAPIPDEKSSLSDSETEQRIISELKGVHGRTQHQPQVLYPTPTTYHCYHNDCEFQTDDEREYRRHWAQKHTGNPVLYPTKTELEKYRLKAQGKEWEV
jgi:hypothetical protein